MPKPQQPTKPISEAYNRLEFLRETEILHKRLNALILSPVVSDLETVKADYAAGDVGTAANIASALNVLAAAVNLNTVAMNQLLAKLNLT